MALCSERGTVHLLAVSAIKCMNIIGLSLTGECAFGIIPNVMCMEFPHGSSRADSSGMIERARTLYGIPAQYTKLPTRTNRNQSVCES